MNLLDLEDEVCAVSIIAEKANAMAEYLKESYFGKRQENVKADELEYEYATASTFMEILHDYIYAAVEKLNNLCDTIPKEFMKGDEKK